MHTTKINERERETDTHKEQKKDGDRGKVETDAQTGGAEIIEDLISGANCILKMGYVVLLWDLDTNSEVKGKFCSTSY